MVQGGGDLPDGESARVAEFDTRGFRQIYFLHDPGFSAGRAARKRTGDHIEMRGGEVGCTGDRSEMGQHTLES